MRLYLLAVCILLLNIGMIAASGSVSDHASAIPADIATLCKGKSVRQIKTMADSLQFRHPSPEKIHRAEALYRAALSKSVGTLDADDEKALAATYSNYSTLLLFERNNPIQAYPMLKNAYDLIEKYRADGFSLVSTYTNLSHVFANFNDYSRAIEYLKEGFSSCLESDNPARAGYIYAQMIYMAWNFGMLENIEAEMKTFNTDPRIRESIMYRYNMEATLAAEDFMDGDYREAAQHMVTALKYIESEYDPQIYRSMTLLMAAQAWMRYGDIAAAKRLIDEAESCIAGYREYNALDFLDRVKEEYYRCTDNRVLADCCRLHSIMLRDSLYSARNLTAIADMEQDRITSRFNAELREAAIEKAMLADKNARQRTALVTVCCLSAIIITMLLLLINKKRKLAEYREGLFRRNMDLIRKSPALPVEAHDATEPVGGAAVDDGYLKETPTSSGNTAPDGHESTTADSEIMSVYAKVQEFFATRREIYDAGFSINTLSSLCGLSVKQISAAVNQCSGKNFSMFMAEYRIHEACRILLDTTPAVRPTIEYVADKVGYTRSHFSRTFKSVTGLTTTEFLRQSALSRRQDSI